jgi:hypothetical protein
METIHTRIWQEEAEPDNAFAAQSVIATATMSTVTC